MGYLLIRNKKAKNYPLSKKLQDGFKEIEDLGDNWDSYGASAITYKAIKAAKLIAGCVPEDKQPEVAPSKTGGVELYFKFKGSADILIHADGKTISYIREPEEE